ncbi:serine/threonine-protein kinase [Solirubrobacter soli]|uniref:serine/threonine-protein kinase n=1 Tax=Solirubrobacter soli TaxID=363832 RepID=UPI00040C5DE2|nr:serine/threonine-protein kinase [Solirubrobacter soli]
MTELVVGSTFAEHEIVAVAGRGGMGVVYRARHIPLKREVALKVIAPALSADEEFRARFRREAEVAASIQHPNVVAIHHAGEADGRLYVTMRFVDGVDLATVVARDGPLPPARAAAVVAQVAGALDAAHACGVVHRDVKPANVLLDGEQAILTDFGLTTRADGSSTAAGTMLGSFDYMAPEQIEESPVDARTDVYALGAVLYFALTGSVPFPRENLGAKLHAHLTAPPPELGHAQLSAVVARALAKAPGERYATAGALGCAALAAVEPGTGFVGRAGPLDRIEHKFALVAQRRRQFVLLAGEPGIGKTRLALEAARRTGAVVLHGRSDADSLVPYQPFVTALSRHFAAGNDLELPTGLEPELQELARLIPALRHRVRDSIADDPEMRRYRLFAAVARVLDSLGPVVLVLDDLQWADASTVRLLTHLLRDAEPSCLLVIGTVREPAPAMAALYRDWERIALGGLDATEVRALVGAEHDVASLLERTDGNPFFIQETLRSLADAGGDLDALEVPESVKALIASRLSRLDATTVEVLTLASVVGREFGLDVIEALVDAPEEELISGLEDAVAAGLVRELPDVPDRFAFVHALVRETLYERQSTSRRVRAHHRIALALEGRAPAAELAHHFRAARHLDTGGAAVRYSVLAAEQATASLAYDEAVAHLRVAAAERQDAALLVALGAAEQRAGDPAAATTFRAAAGLAREAGDGDRLAEAALGLAGRGVQGASIDTGPVALLEEALHGCSGALAARVLAALANALHFAAGEARVNDLSARALAAAQASGDPVALVAAIESRHGARFHISHLDERLALGSELLELALSIADRELEGLALHWRVYDLIEGGEVAAARTAHSRLAALAAERRQPRLAYDALRWDLVWAQMADELETADTLIERVHELGRRALAPEADTEYAAQRLALAYRQGAIAGLAPMLAGAVEANPHLVLYRPALALALGRAGDRDGCRREFEALAGDGFAAVPRDILWFSAICLLGEVCALLGDAERARVLYALILPHRERNVMVGMATCWGSAERYLALLAAAAGDAAAADEHVALALARNAASGITSMVRLIQDQ